MKGMKAYGKYGSLGLELLLSMAVGYYGGAWIDGKLGTRWVALVGFLLGCYAGFRALFKAAKRMEKDIANDEKLARGEDPWAPRAEGEDDPDWKDAGDTNAGDTNADEPKPPGERERDGDRKP